MDAVAAVTRRRAQQEGPTLFDVVDEQGDREPGTFRAAAPQRQARADKPAPLPPPAAPAGDEILERAAEIKARWAESTRRARAKFEGDDRP
jgi:hypothetical protein